MFTIFKEHYKTLILVPLSLLSSSMHTDKDLNQNFQIETISHDIFETVDRMHLHVLCQVFVGFFTLIMKVIGSHARSQQLLEASG